MKKLGIRIRSERKRQGLTIEELAEKVGITSVTLHRIETGKTSPSVVLLSEIAQNLNTSITSFVRDIDKPLVLIKDEAQETISSGALMLKLIGPPKMITKDIRVTYGELKKGKRIDSHSNPGIEWAYVLKGKCEHEQKGQKIIMEAGDSMSYNSSVEHSITALEKLKFIAIYVKESE